MPDPLRILIADDDKSVCYALERVLTEDGHVVSFAFLGKECLQLLKQSRFDAMLLDLVMPDLDGLEVLRQVKERHPALEVVTMSGMGSMRTALKTLNLGAFDFLTKPIQPAALSGVIERLQKKAPAPRGDPSAPPPAPDLIGRSPSIRKVMAMVDKIAPTQANILIRGETGTGKEVVAHRIHNQSARRAGPFIAVNCSALPDALLESELFGHEKGAFTDASGQKKGLFEVADGGTLFLDEIGEVSLPLQAKLLRVVETKRFRRLGSTEERAVDVRILSATNRNLEAAVKSGQFREDLFYRLRVITLHMPPLRDRKEDIPLLVEHFLEALAAPGREPKRTSDQALSLLVEYGWPGNIRELHNVVEQSVVFSESEEINATDLPAAVQAGAPVDAMPAAAPTATPAAQTLEDVEKSHILRVLGECGQDAAQAARVLGISAKSLQSKIKKYRISLRSPQS